MIAWNFCYFLESDRLKLIVSNNNSAWLDNLSYNIIVVTKDIDTTQHKEIFKTSDFSKLKEVLKLKELEGSIYCY